jgi:hypothetical protein
MKRIASFVLMGLALVSLAVAQDKPTGPFGFVAGMSREQIVKLVGAGAVVKPPTAITDPTLMFLNSAPTPNRNFETYSLVISPTQGLVKLGAIGTTLTTSDTGAELKTAFHTVVDAISQKYGSPKVFDSCSGSDVECENSQFWMMSLRNKNRQLGAFWVLTEPINGVTTLMVEANYETMNSGYIDVHYEFVGFHQYSAARQAKQDAAY